MSQYLLSTYQVEGEVPGAPGSPEEMQQFMQRVMALEAEMDAAGVFVFGGALAGPDASTVLTRPAADIGRQGSDELYLQPRQSVLPQGQSPHHLGLGSR